MADLYSMNHTSNHYPITNRNVPMPKFIIFSAQDKFSITKCLLGCCISALWRLWFPGNVWLPRVNKGFNEVNLAQMAVPIQFIDGTPYLDVTLKEFK